MDCSDAATDSKPPMFPITGIICAGLLLNYAVPGPVGEFSSAGLPIENIPFRYPMHWHLVLRSVYWIAGSMIRVSLWYLYHSNTRRIWKYH